MSRLALAFSCFFRALRDAEFAERCLAPQLPTVPDPVSEAMRAEAPVVSVHSSPTIIAQRADRGLQVLELLQKEGRLIDFLEQDILSFSDADVGAAARVIHEGCRRAVRSVAEVVPIREEAEGAVVKLEAGFDPAMHKLIGSVTGNPPFSGRLLHRGWRAKSLELPDPSKGYNPFVLAPAEIEL